MSDPCVMCILYDAYCGIIAALDLFAKSAAFFPITASLAIWLAAMMVGMMHSNGYNKGG